MPAEFQDDIGSDSSVDHINSDGQQPASVNLDDLPAEGEGASSSTAQQSEDKDLLSVVRDVVSESQQSAPASQADEREATGQQADGSQPENAPNGDDEFKDVPFNKHPRFRQLVQERNSFKENAQRYENIQNFLRETGVQDAEAAGALEIVAIAKVNPTLAWERIKPFVQDLLTRAGEVLPEDLQQRVAQGEMSREAAMELSRARANLDSTRGAQEMQRQRAEEVAREQHAAALRDTAQTWETSRRVSDPDFEKKLPYLQREIAYRHRRGEVPTTPEGVRQQLEDVHRTVSAELRQFVQPARQRPAVRPVMGGQVATDARPAPRSTLEVIQQTVEQMQAS